MALSLLSILSLCSETIFLVILLLESSSVLSVSEAHLIHQTHSYFLDVNMKLTPKYMICHNTNDYNNNYIISGKNKNNFGSINKQCRIPYALSVLISPNRFDPQSIVLKEGQLTYSNGHFNDSTVVRLSRAVIHHEEKCYLGLKLFDIPGGSQDYFIVDVTRVIDAHKPSKVEMITDSFRLVMKVSKEREVSARGPSPINRRGSKVVDWNDELSASDCGCWLNKCGCCKFISIPKIHLNDNVCANITYNPQILGLELTVSINDHVIFRNEFSLRNPPPLCFEVPGLAEYAALCIRLVNIDIGRDHLSGCLELDAHMYHLRIARVKLGCFNIPVAKSLQMPIDTTP